MAGWGAHSFDSDEAMDRVGDVWRELFIQISMDVTIEVLTPIFEKQGTDLCVLLWTCCANELPERLLNRIACLLTTYEGIATAFLAKIGHSVVNEVLVKTYSSVPEYGRMAVVGAISYFVNRVGLRIEATLVKRASEGLTLMIANSKDEIERETLLQELKCLDIAKS